MTEQEQQIALCEWAGWRTNKEMLTHAVVNPFQAPDGSWHKAYPDTNSLDVLHAMEKKLRPGLKNLYASELRAACADIDVWHATAAQRREALLRTLGLWKEDK